MSARLAALLAQVEERIAAVVRPSSGHAVQRAASDAARGGKRLRPRLLIAAAGTEAAADDVVRAAAAIELVHAALLVHDDVIDGDEERRGAPSIASAASAAAQHDGIGAAHAARLGMTTAIVTGDVLLARALVELARLDADATVRGRVLDIVERSLLEAAEGEYDDVRLAGADPSEQEIRKLLEQKTADYSFRAPLEVGALLGGRSEEAIRALGRIGLRIGVLYQLRDDVLGTFGDEATTGKSTLSDIRAGAPTLLAHLARPHPAWQPAARHYGDPFADERAGVAVREALTSSGALATLERSVREDAAAIERAIEAAPVEPALRAELLALLAGSVERER